MAKKATNNNNEIENHIEKYKKTMMEGDKIQGRAFDLCYAYFQENKGKLLGENKQTSCMQLWSFLANWGMINNNPNCKLLNYNYSSLLGIITFINDKKNAHYFDISLENYSCDKYVESVMDLYEKLEKEIRFLNQARTQTIITKIILGVYGCCPAIDSHVRKAFGLNNKNLEQILRIIHETYHNKNNKVVFDNKKIAVIAFDGKPIPKLHYPAAKLVDMHGYIKGE